MIGVDLFSGAGGMSLGAQWAGIEVRTAFELHHAAALTYARNHPNATMIQGDLRYISNVLSSRETKQELVLFGGPPCQAFSTSNQKSRGPSNPKNWLYRDFLKLARALGPDWIVFENVPGILERRSLQYVKEIERHLVSLGYSLSSGVLNSADFGVPQRRKRFFMIAARNQKAPPLPSPIAGSPITVGDAFEDLPVLRNGSSNPQKLYRGPAKSKYAKLMRGRLKECGGHLVSYNAPEVIKRYKYIPAGGNWADIPARLMGSYEDRTRCHTGIYHRLDPDEPSVVIGNFRKNMLIHPTQSRGLSVREAARLQSFPDWYEFFGSIGLQQQQVGNAVPPLLAKAVFESISSPP